MEQKTYTKGYQNGSSTKPTGGFKKKSGFGSMGGSRSFSSGRGKFNNRGGGGNRRKTGSFIDFSKFVNRAVTTTEEVYVPTHSFTDFEMNETLKKTILARGYTTPSPIQDKAIPAGLEGRDIVGLANTGTGKTAAFLIPIIDRISKGLATKAIIMAPTRELAIQVEREAYEFIKGQRMWTVVCVGGAPIFKQINELKRKHHIVIGTPGRLKDLYDRGALYLADTDIVVLDEADQMLDMGFIDDMRLIIQKTKTERQTLLFSATLPPAIEKFIYEFTKEPIKISVKSRDTSKNIDQDVVEYKERHHKIEQLHDLLVRKEFDKVLIFGETKHGVEDLTEELQKRGFAVESIHGDKRHRERQRSLKKFKDSDVQVLIATDVAARGLDINDVSHVINYEIPSSYETYIHRIGRTGRAGKTGKALTFIPTRR